MVAWLKTLLVAFTLMLGIGAGVGVTQHAQVHQQQTLARYVAPSCIGETGPPCT
jgi:hypothetical protein